MKPVLMIHEIKESLFDLPLEDYILTFDDGLYSQYYYRKKFLELNTTKIYFISTKYICDSNQSRDFPTSIVAHEKARTGNYEDFMTLHQIKELQKDPNVYIGGHSHSHLDLREMPSLLEKVNHIRKDTEQMINWFATNLNSLPTRFCYPYNYDLNGIYPRMLKRYGITKYFGSERIPA